jgi:hypothetical protein
MIYMAMKFHDTLFLMGFNRISYHSSILTVRKCFGMRDAHFRLSLHVTHRTQKKTSITVSTAH